MGSAARLFGRARDIDDVASTLARTGRCTIVGPGGVGKTSVAEVVVTTRIDRPVAWIDAEPIDRVDALLDEVVRRIGIERLPNETPTEAIMSALDGSRLLIVLDGVEHLDEGLARIVQRWPTSPAGPWLLVTSRRPLNPSLLPLVRLEPLVADDTVDGTRSPAAEMLIHAVLARGGDERDLLDDPERFGRVLRATGGLPVAITLTADHVARFGVRFAAAQPHSIDQIVEHCIERTLTLLTDDERLVFERLGLTAGTFTFDLIMACRDDADRPSAELVASRLVDHGLMRAIEGRLDMLPPIRDGAAALLARRGTLDDTIEQLLRWLLDSSTNGSGANRSSVENDLDTCIHLAWLALDVRSLRPRAVELIMALFSPMYSRLRQPELLRLLEAALADDATIDPRRFAELARRAAICASECSTIAHARRWLDRAIDVADQLSDSALRAQLWSIEAWLALDAGDHTRAIESAERSLLGTPSSRDPDLTLQSLRCIAETALAMGDLDLAEATARDVVDRAASVDPGSGLVARTTLGWCLVERGRHLEAVAHARRLADDIRNLHSELAEIEVEAELIAMAADPHTEPIGPSLDNDHRFTWWMRLQQRLRLAARLAIDEHWEHVMHTAADVVVLAELIPLGHPRLCATILLGDAALAGGDVQHAARAYERALRDAVRGPYRLRGADVLDGVAVVAAKLGDDAVAGSAATTAAEIRHAAGAAPWPRPSLPTTVAPNGRVPAGWLHDGRITMAAIDAISGALRRPNRPDPFESLTHAERHVAELVRQGMTNNEIAEHLVVSRRTVESHLARTYRKLGIRTRTQLATIAPGLWR